MGRAGPPPAPLPDPFSTDPHHQPLSILSSSSHFLSSDLTSTSAPSSDLTSSSVLASDLVATTSSAGQGNSDLQPSRRRSSLSTRSSGLAVFSSRSSYPAALSSSVHILPHQSASSPSRSSGVAAVSPSSSNLAAARDLAAAGSTAVHVHPPSSSQASSSSQPLPSFSAVRDPTRSELSPPPSLSSAPQPSAQPPPHSQLPSSPPVQLRSSAQGVPPSGLAPRSYAQVSQSSKGTGFVRSHAEEIESFARLPRIGANIICGHKEGIPSFSFVSSDLPSVENLYSNALIMKFHGGRPSLEASHKEIQSWGLDHPFTIGPLTSRSFLLRFQDNKDLIRVLSRPSTLLISFSYKIFKWHNLCHLTEDSCFAPVWISLPRLPLQCFIPEFLETVANKIGRFLCFDKATSTLARPSAARLCIEVDLRKSLPSFIWIGLFEGFKQPIIYERLPKFCNLCLAQGHDAIGCPVGRRETLPTHPEARSMHNRQRTPGVRRYAAKTLSTQKLNVSTHAAVSTPLLPSHAQSAPGYTARIAIPSPQTASHPPDDEVLHQQPHPSSPEPLQSHQPDVAQPAVPSFAHAAVPHPPLQSSATTLSTSTPAPIVDHFQLHPTSQRAPTAAASSITPSPKHPLIPQPTAAPPPNDALLQVQASGSLLQQDPAVTATLAAPSVGSEHQQTNVEANIELWEAVSRQVAILEQARITPSPSLLPDAARHQPTDIASPVAATRSEAGPSDVHLQAQQSAALLQQPSAAAGPPDAPAQLSSALLQRDPTAAAPSAGNESAATSPPPATSAISVHATDRVIPTVTQSSKSLKGKHKSINFQPSAEGTSASLPQKQRAALEQFKSKLHHSQIGGQQPISVNHFEALRYDHSDADGDDASYYSDTDDGCVDPIELGYQSANGRSSNKLKDFASSGMRTNKRHPNMPLRVKLRSRKDSHPSTP